MKVLRGAILSAAAAVLFAPAAFGQQGSEGQMSDPGMQQSQSQQQQKSESAMMSPDTIKQVQQALNEKGFQAGPVDGKWGSKTESAVKNFQQDQGMQASGSLDQQTLAALGVSEGAAAGGQEMQKEKEEEMSGAGGQDSMSGDQQQSGMESESQK